MPERFRWPTGATAVQQTADSREDHSDEDRKRRDIPERTEGNVECRKQRERERDHDGEAAVLLLDHLISIPDSPAIVLVNDPNA
jgi:hypothetical protein